MQKSHKNTFLEETKNITFNTKSAVEEIPFKIYTHHQIDKISALGKIPEELRFHIKVVAQVLPFRVNQYVIDQLIDWDNIPEDPIFRLTFPQKDMLEPESFDKMAELINRDAPKTEIQQLATQIRQGLNPHPAGQMKLNVPVFNDQKLSGIQHKYNETVLFFPSQGQTCHSYCTFCFRWAQFVGDKELRFAAKEASTLFHYLRSHQEVTDVLITGGDPMVMKTKNLQRYLEGLTDPALEHTQTIRIGSKSLSFWPYRFVTDPDADELLRLFERLVAHGKHVTLMAHYNHWQEMNTPVSNEAIRRIQNTGVQIRSQGPLLANINDNAAIWGRLWKEQVKSGIIPYYMFVERDTGAHRYFKVPLGKAWSIYRDAMQSVSGLGRTARGPSMSCGPGKIEVQGITEIHGEKVFVLRFIQGRNADWVQRPFFSEYDEQATWLDDLKPAFGEKKFFFETEYQQIKNKISSINVRET